jgi:hypothetical protein
MAIILHEKRDGKGEFILHATHNHKARIRGTHSCIRTASGGVQ